MVLLLLLLLSSLSTSCGYTPSFSSGHASLSLPLSLLRGGPAREESQNARRHDRSQLKATGSEGQSKEGEDRGDVHVQWKERKEKPWKRTEAGAKGAKGAKGAPGAQGAAAVRGSPGSADTWVSADDRDASLPLQPQGSCANAFWRAISAADLRQHPLYRPLPEVVLQHDAQSLQLFRQDSWQWDALHLGRMTTSKASACLGFYEVGASAPSTPALLPFYSHPHYPLFPF
jgi:hypothetical protein